MTVQCYMHRMLWTYDCSVLYSKNASLRSKYCLGLILQMFHSSCIKHTEQSHLLTLEHFRMIQLSKGYLGISSFKQPVSLLCPLCGLLTILIALQESHCPSDQKIQPQVLGEFWWLLVGNLFCGLLTAVSNYVCRYQENR